jgi:hypothetical protein
MSCALGQVDRMLLVAEIDEHMKKYDNPVKRIDRQHNAEDVKVRMRECVVVSA